MFKLSHNRGKVFLVLQDPRSAWRYDSTLLHCAVLVALYGCRVAVPPPYPVAVVEMAAQTQHFPVTILCIQ